MPLNSELRTPNSSLLATHDARRTTFLSLLASGLWPLASLFCLLTSPVHAQDLPEGPLVKAELALDCRVAEASRNDEAECGANVTFTMPEGWHIYYKDPGDSGMPTTLDWTLPAGLTVGETQWPTPERIDEAGIHTNGYHGTATLSTPLLGQGTGEVRVLAKWLVCKESCIPESAELVASKERGQRPEARGQESKESGILRSGPPLGGGREPGGSPCDRASSVGGKKLSLCPPTKSEDGFGSPTPVAKRREAKPTGELGSPASPLATGDWRLVTPLLLAFLGGLILNIMPCVLPILALKALAIAKKAEASRGAAARQGLAYTLGVVGSFLAIAGLMLALKASGHAVGWGFQLQNPVFVGGMVLLMLAVAANLLGLFTLPTLLGRRAMEADDSSLHGSFLTGALAVLVATPCTAPFMATALGATLTMTTLAALAVFAALGLGMAAPFLLISVWPAARRLLPKPGAWMVRFKHALALPMLATAVWLGWVLMQLLSPAAPMKDVRHVPYSAEALASLRAEGGAVLVDATAAWCLTCKVNERVALNTPDMQRFFEEHGIVLMVADWTNGDPAITALLAQFGRNGVPLYVYYPPDPAAAPIVLPQILTPSVVREVIENDPILKQSNADMDAIDAAPDATIEPHDIILPNGIPLDDYNCLRGIRVEGDVPCSQKTREALQKKYPKEDWE